MVSGNLTRAMGRESGAIHGMFTDAAADFIGMIAAVKMERLG